MLKGENIVSLKRLPYPEQGLRWDHPTHPEMGYSYREVAKVKQLNCFKLQKKKQKKNTTNGAIITFPVAYNKH